jgi:hypothetical protein
MAVGPMWSLTAEALEHYDGRNHALGITMINLRLHQGFARCHAYLPAEVFGLLMGRPQARF